MKTFIIEQCGRQGTMRASSPEHAMFRFYGSRIGKIVNVGDNVFSVQDNADGRELARIYEVKPGVGT